MRRTTTLTALLLGTALLAPTGLATAAGETCRGEAATIVGTGYHLHGTEGRDVIVTGASGNIVAGGGDDVICATGAGSSGNTMTIDAGTGNDVVDSTTMEDGYYLHAILGDGADTFVGGPEDERVTAGPAAPLPADPDLSEADRDQIDTGGGTDGVTSGGPGLPNDDVVRTGTGDDFVRWSGTMGAAGLLDGGEGEDRLNLRASGQTFRVDLTAQTLTRDGVRAASFSSFEALLRVSPEPGLGAVEILGTGDDDLVEIDGPALVRADLGQGDDQLDLDGTMTGSRFDLGAGDDGISVRSWAGSVELDLADGGLTVDGSSVATLAGVEGASVSAQESTVIGNGESNVLFVVGCTATIDGRGDDDVVIHGNYDFDADRGYDCEQGRATLRGGSGNDELQGGKRADRIYGGSGDDDIRTGPAVSGKNKAWGGQGNDRLDGGSAKDVLSGGAGKDRLKGDKQADVLLGGGGKDRSVGGPGRDRCTAEVERSCER